jgi:type VI secretion system protein VasJ
MPTYREEVAQRVAPLLAPLAGTNPAGVDISYDPQFERVKAEIDKLSSVDNLEPSWKDVQEVGAGLLSSKSKDLRIASWMGVAKVKTGGWPGFAETLVLYDGLSRSFWDVMFPEVRRARARVNAFSWLAEMVVKHLEPLDVGFGDADAVRACDEVLKDLDQLLADKLGELYPGPGQLRSLLRDKVRAIPEPAAPAASPVETAAAEATNGVAAGAPAPTIAAATSVEDVGSAVRENGHAIVAAAAILRAADPTRAWAYKLQRWGAWIAIEDAPPSEDGQTRLPPPPDDLRQKFSAARDAQKWLELLHAAEEATGEYLFWLDAHRNVANALDRLGPGFAAAREVVGREVASFVARLPKLDTLCFSDGTPFAEAATRSWLEEDARKYGGSGGSAGAAAASAEDEEIAKRFTEAQKMVAEGKVGDGLAVALALADRGADGRVRFRSRLAVGKMALDGSKPELARPLLEHLLGDVERHGLEAWEPGLCASLYAQLLVATREVSRAKGGPAELVAKEQYLFERLCRIDPAAAMKLSV